MNDILYYLNIFIIFIFFKIISLLYKYKDIANLIEELKYYDKTNYKKIKMILIKFKEIDKQKKYYNILLTILLIVYYVIKINHYQ